MFTSLLFGLIALGAVIWIIKNPGMIVVLGLIALSMRECGIWAI